MKTKGRHSARIRKMILNEIRSTKNGYCSVIKLSKKGHYIWDDNGYLKVVKNNNVIRYI